MIELKTLIDKYIAEGESINKIKKEFLLIINNHTKVKKPKKAKKREICRPVMFISDSSCDEEN